MNSRIQRDASEPTPLLWPLDQTAAPRVSSPFPSPPCFRHNPCSTTSSSTSTSGLYTSTDSFPSSLTTHSCADGASSLASSQQQQEEVKASASKPTRSRTARPLERGAEVVSTTALALDSNRTRRPQDVKSATSRRFKDRNRHRSRCGPAEGDAVRRSSGRITSGVNVCSPACLRVLDDHPKEEARGEAVMPHQAGTSRGVREALPQRAEESGGGDSAGGERETPPSSSASDPTEGWQRPSLRRCCHALFPRSASLSPLSTSSSPSHLFPLSSLLEWCCTALWRGITSHKVYPMLCQKPSDCRALFPSERLREVKGRRQTSARARTTTTTTSASWRPPREEELLLQGGVPGGAHGWPGVFGMLRAYQHQYHPEAATSETQLATEKKRDTITTSTRSPVVLLSDGLSRNISSCSHETRVRRSETYTFLSPSPTLHSEMDASSLLGDPTMDEEEVIAEGNRPSPPPPSLLPRPIMMDRGTLTQLPTRHISTVGSDVSTIDGRDEAVRQAVMKGEVATTGTGTRCSPLSIHYPAAPPPEQTHPLHHSSSPLPSRQPNDVTRDLTELDEECDGLTTPVQHTDTSVHCATPVVHHTPSFTQRTLSATVAAARRLASRISPTQKSSPANQIPLDEWARDTRDAAGFSAKSCGPDGTSLETVPLFFSNARPSPHLEFHHAGVGWSSELRGGVYRKEECGVVLAEGESEGNEREVEAATSSSPSFGAMLPPYAPCGDPLLLHQRTLNASTEREDASALTRVLHWFPFRWRWVSAGLHPFKEVARQEQRTWRSAPGWLRHRAKEWWRCHGRAWLSPLSVDVLLNDDILPHHRRQTRYAAVFPFPTWCSSSTSQSGSSPPPNTLPHCALVPAAGLRRSTSRGAESAKGVRVECSTLCALPTHERASCSLSASSLQHTHAMVTHSRHTSGASQGSCGGTAVPCGTASAPSSSCCPFCGGLRSASVSGSSCETGTVLDAGVGSGTTTTPAECGVAPTCCLLHLTRYLQDLERLADGDAEETAKDSAIASRGVAATPQPPRSRDAVPPRGEDAVPLSMRSAGTAGGRETNSPSCASAPEWSPSLGTGYQEGCGAAQPPRALTYSLSSMPSLYSGAGVLDLPGGPRCRSFLSSSRGTVSHAVPHDCTCGHRSGKDDFSGAGVRGGTRAEARWPTSSSRRQRTTSLSFSTTDVGRSSPPPTADSRQRSFAISTPSSQEAGRRAFAALHGAMVVVSGHDGAPYLSGGGRRPYSSPVMRTAALRLSPPFAGVGVATPTSPCEEAGAPERYRSAAERDTHRMDPSSSTTATPTARGEGLPKEVCESGDSSSWREHVHLPATSFTVPVGHLGSSLTTLHVSSYRPSQLFPAFGLTNVSAEERTAQLLSALQARRQCQQRYSCTAQSSSTRDESAEGRDAEAPGCSGNELRGGGVGRGFPTHHVVSSRQYSLVRSPPSPSPPRGPSTAPPTAAAARETSSPPYGATTTTTGMTNRVVTAQGSSGDGPLHSSLARHTTSLSSLNNTSGVEGKVSYAHHRRDGSVVDSTAPSASVVVPQGGELATAPSHGRPQPPWPQHTKTTSSSSLITSIAEGSPHTNLKDLSVSLDGDHSVDPAARCRGSRTRSSASRSLPPPVRMRSPPSASCHHVCSVSPPRGSPQPTVCRRRRNSFTRRTGEAATLAYHDQLCEEEALEAALTSPPPSSLCAAEEPTGGDVFSDPRPTLSDDEEVFAFRSRGNAAPPPLLPAPSLSRPLLVEEADGGEVGGGAAWGRTTSDEETIAGSTDSHHRPPTITRHSLRPTHCAVAEEEGGRAILDAPSLMSRPHSRVEDETTVVPMAALQSSTATTTGHDSPATKVLLSSARQNEDQKGVEAERDDGAPPSTRHFFATAAPAAGDGVHSHSPMENKNADAPPTIAAAAVDGRQLSLCPNGFGAPLPRCEPRLQGPRLSGTTGQRGEMVIGAFLGGGACGRVYECLNTETGELLAVKQIVYSEKDVRLKHQLHQLAVELEVMHLSAEFPQQGIVEFYCVEKRGHSVLIYMEYCQQGSLLDYLLLGSGFTGSTSDTLSGWRTQGSRERSAPHTGGGHSLRTHSRSPSRLPSGSRPLRSGTSSLPLFSVSAPHIGSVSASASATGNARGAASHSRPHSVPDAIAGVRATTSRPLPQCGSGRSSTSQCSAAHPMNSTSGLERQEGVLVVSGGEGGRRRTAKGTQPPPLTAAAHEPREAEETEAHESDAGAPNPLPIREVQRVTKQIVAALAFLHAHRYAHLDIKTPNVLITGDGDCRLADFGCAARLLPASCRPSSTPATAAGRAGSTEKQPAHPRAAAAREYAFPVVADQKELTEPRGTALYMAPEMIRLETERIGTAADIWSLGCVVMELATGRSPWRHIGREKLKVLFTVASAVEALPLPPSVLRRANPLLGRSRPCTTAMSCPSSAGPGAEMPKKENADADALRWQKAAVARRARGLSNETENPITKRSRVESSSAEGDRSSGGDVDVAAATDNKGTNASAPPSAFAVRGTERTQGRPFLPSDAVERQRGTLTLYENLVDFIAQCTRLHPEERPSAESLLQHPFCVLPCLPPSSR